MRRLVDRFDVTAAVQVPLGDEAPLPGIPNLALRRERAPNLAGAELLGLHGGLGAPRSGRPAAAAVVVVLDAELEPADEAALAAAPGVVVVLGTVARRRRSATPSWCCRSPPWRRRTAPMSTATGGCSAISRPRVAARHGAAGLVGGGRGARRARARARTRPSTAAEAFALLGERWPVFAGLSHADLGFTGRVLRPPRARAHRGAGAAR